MLIRSYRYKLNPTKRQHVALESVLESQRQLYNAALQERIDCYKKTGKGIRYYDQQKSLTEIRLFDTDYSDISACLSRWTLLAIDQTYKGFFRRVKSGQKAGFPRFKTRDRWNTFGFSEMNGVRITKDKKLAIKGIKGKIRVNWHRAMTSDDVKMCSITKSGKNWHISFRTETHDPDQADVKSITGIDLGISSLATLSNGDKIEPLKATKQYAKELRLKQRKLSRCKRNSNNRKKQRVMAAKVHTKIKNTRQTYLHQVSRKLVNTYDLIALEDLKIANMVRNPSLSKSIYDCSWSTLIHMLTYKAEEAGKLVVKVNPRNTSQECSGCHNIVKKTLGQRIHDCPHCGICIDRDHNAAINILNRAVVGPEIRNLGVVMPSVSRNINLEKQLLPS